MILAQLCGLFAVVCIGAFVWMFGSDLIDAAPGIFAWSRCHIAATVFWVSAAGFAVCFVIGIRN